MPLDNPNQNQFDCDAFAKNDKKDNIYTIMLKFVPLYVCVCVCVCLSVQIDKI